MMESIRKWLYKPKRDDKSLLAQFFYADEDLNAVANELDSFDGRKDPERCTSLVNRLRQAQDKVLTITNGIMDALIADERANRDFRVKFPEDVLQENLAGQLWFGAECLAAGSSIMNREAESTAMRPLAKAVTKSLENVRNLLRDACLRNNIPNGPIQLDINELFTEMLLESLKIFDRLFAEFELAYVSAMVPIKSTQEYELQELIGVLFSETLQRALKMNLLTQEMVDDCDPALMFAIPRLAIVSGLLVFPDGPLCIDKPVEKMSELFRPFRTLLLKIRDLLWILNKRELYLLEKLLCDNEQVTNVKSFFDMNLDSNRDEFFDHFYSDYSPFDKIRSNKLTQDIKDNQSPVELPKNNSMSTLNNFNEPSTSASLIPASVVRNTVIAEYESPPDHDSQEIISIAAATLSSILNTSDSPVSRIHDKEADDSGISTEVTSLDRSPSLDLGDTRNPQKPTNYIKNRFHHPAHSIDRFNQPNGNEFMYSSSSSDTSSFNSLDADDEEIALAVKAAEIANNNVLRAKFRSCEDLIHRLFVCIAGVADQLQTNFACDLRNILRSVFLINSSDAIESPKSLETSSLSLDSSIEYRPSEDEVIENNEFSVDPDILAQEALFDTNVYFHLETEGCMNTEYSNHPRQNDDQASLSSLSSELNRYASLRDDVNQLNPPVSPAPPYENEDNDVEVKPPMWVPDVQAPKCMSCYCTFTVVKRRHHCRNCGKVFCGKCSSNSVPLPKYGITKPVRVCNKCFIYNLTPFITSRVE